MKFSNLGARLDGAISQVVPVTKSAASTTAAKTKQATVASAVAVRNTSDKVVTRLSDQPTTEQIREAFEAARSEAESR